MRNGMKIVTLILLALSDISYAGESPEEFFKNYIELGENFSPSVASLYTDNAKIHAYRVYPHGLERTMELSGSQWKNLVIKVMPIAKAQNDKSTFSNVVITQEGKGHKIKADRYSDRKCYTDSGYYMIVQPTEKGQLEITEEYMETQPQSNC